MNQFAIENEVAIVLPCELPTGPGIAISRAVNAFTAIPEIATVFIAWGQSKLAAVKLPTGNGIREFGFRIRRRNSMPTVVWDKLADDTMSGSLFDFEPPTESGFVTPSVEEKILVMRVATIMPAESQAQRLTRRSRASCWRTLLTPRTLAMWRNPKSPEPASLGAAPEAARIKYRDIQVPGYMTGRTRRVVVVRRKSRKPKKVRGPLDNSPF